MGTGGHSKQPGGGNQGDPNPPSFQFSSSAMSEKESKRFLTQLASGSGTSAPETRANDAADVGSVMWERIALGAIVVLLPLVIWLQQFTRYLGGETLSDAPESVKQNETVREPGVSELTIYSKIAVKMAVANTEMAHGDQPRHKPIKASDTNNEPTAKKASPGAGSVSSKSVPVVAGDP